MRTAMGCSRLQNELLKENLASYLGVAIVEEGVTLRRNSNRSPGVGADGTAGTAAWFVR